MNTDEKLAHLKKNLKNYGSLLVAYSGGVDSALLAVIAKEVLGDKAACVFLEGEEVPRKAVADAKQTAQTLGIPCETATYPIMEVAGFRENSPDRCYHCRKGSAGILKSIARNRGIAHVADGINASDLGEHRPGVRASTEEGILHPFVDAGITKPEIRAIAKSLGLPIWDKPSAACTASRIPYGEEITIRKLRRIEKAEEYLASLGFAQLRVRSHGDIARIEIPDGDISRIVPLRKQVSDHLRSIGFSYITLDLEGYRTGSMDEVLPK